MPQRFIRELEAPGLPRRDGRELDWPYGGFLGRGFDGDLVTRREAQVLQPVRSRLGRARFPRDSAMGFSRATSTTPSLTATVVLPAARRTLNSVPTARTLTDPA
jgi:hypothetical protein